MHVYAFGSICRGDINVDSDIDLLAIVDGHDARFNPDVFSIYSYGRIKELWDEGNPFAWHLALESHLVYTADQTDYLRSLGKPNKYQNCVCDCEKFYNLFRQAYQSLTGSEGNRTFELSMVLLSVRNIATCYSLGVLSQPKFSRRSALQLDVNSAPISEDVYKILERARVLSTRGFGANLARQEIISALQALPQIDIWMVGLLGETKTYERIQ
jgi:hypothetical protein